jgi:hypothetical protein
MIYTQVFNRFDTHKIPAYSRNDNYKEKDYVKTIT